MPSQAIVFYHADCLDGFGAAYAAWRRFGDSAIYRPMHHGQSWSEEDLRDCDVFILDFSFPVADLLAMARIAKSVCLLDHHVTALQPWSNLLTDKKDAPFHYRHPDWPLTLCFDLNKSGARLAWEHFHPDTPIPLAIAHIEDQDLWRFEIHGTRAFCRALRLRPFNFNDWDGIVSTVDSTQSDSYGRMLSDGEAIERFFALEVERLAGSPLIMPVTLRGEPLDPLQAIRHGLPVTEAEERSWRAVTGLAINANALFASDLGNRLAQRSSSFGLIWQLNGDGEVRASLRACGGINVAEMAQNYGGGGHRNAAGFRLPLQRFMDEILSPALLPSS